MKKLNQIEAIQFLRNNPKAILIDNNGSKLSFVSVLGIRDKVLCWSNDEEQPMWVPQNDNREFTIYSLGGRVVGFRYAFANYKNGATIFSKVSGMIYHDFEETDADKFHHADISGDWEIIKEAGCK